MDPCCRPKKFLRKGGTVNCSSLSIPNLMEFSSSLGKRTEDHFICCTCITGIILLRNAIYYRGNPAGCTSWICMHHLYCYNASLTISSSGKQNVLDYHVFICVSARVPSNHEMLFVEVCWNKFSFQADQNVL